MKLHVETTIARAVGVEGLYNNIQGRKKEIYEKRLEKTIAAKRVSESNCDSDSSIFRPSFAEIVFCALCADDGSDKNLIPPSLHNEIFKEVKYSTLPNLTVPRQYGLAVTTDRRGNSVLATFDKQVVEDILLFILHESVLRLRNITWYVAQQEVPEPLLGKQVLHVL